MAGTKYQTKREFLDRRMNAMELERVSFIAHYKELAEYIQPRRGRFFVEDRNRGDKRYKNIINNCATQALKVARSGMMAGTMSPSHTWFGIETTDSDAMKNQDVRIWCAAVQKIIESIYARSNLYTAASTMFADLLLFSTGAIMQEEDEDTIVNFTTFTAGAYTIAQDFRGRVNAFARKFQMTVKQLVDEFGAENCSELVNTMYNRGDYDQWFNVSHYVGDNEDYAEGKAGNKYKKIQSCYWERGATTANTTTISPTVQDKFLRESGYDDFPFYIPRWDLTDEDIYGTDGPGMVALGDTKQLQLEERRKAQAIDKFVNPPLRGPSSLKNVPVSSLPGGLTIYDGTGDKDGLLPVYQIDPRITELMNDIASIENRIKDSFFTPLFFAISQMEGIQPKNEMELNFRNQEALMQLGPVLERIHTEFLQPCVERTFNIAVKKGMIPPPPPEMAGMGLKVKFISTLAMAQRSDQVSSINDLRLYVSQLASGGFPEAVDKFDADQSIDELSLILGVPPSIVRSEQAATQVRQDRMQQSQQEHQQAAAAQLSQQLITKGTQ